MSITVRLSPGEKFLNWFPYNTKLYIRGERGADHAKANALYRELWEAVNPWLKDLIEKEIEYRIKNQELCRLEPRVPEDNND